MRTTKHHKEPHHKIVELLGARRAQSGRLTTTSRALNAPRRSSREDAEAAAAVARAGAEGQQASSSNGASPPVVFSAAPEPTTSGTPVGDETSTRHSELVTMRNMEDTTAVHQPQAAAPPAEDVEMHRDSTPERGNFFLGETQTLLRLSLTARRPGMLQIAGCAL